MGIDYLLAHGSGGGAFRCAKVVEKGRKSDRFEGFAKAR